MLHTFCPGRGSNQDLLRGSQTLYRVAIKAGLYRKAVQVCIIPNITTISLWGFFPTLKAANSAVYGLILPNFELLQALMHVIVTCQYEKDWMKNSLENVATSIFPL